MSVFFPPPQGLAPRRIEDPEQIYKNPSDRSRYYRELAYRRIIRLRKIAKTGVLLGPSDLKPALDLLSKAASALKDLPDEKAKIDAEIERVRQEFSKFLVAPKEGVK